SSTFTRSPVLINGASRPVVEDNSFKGTDGPLSASSIDDLSGFVGNGATGSFGQRVLSFSSSDVKKPWTLAPSSTALYGLDGVTVTAEGTLTTEAGASIRTGGALKVYGTLNAVDTVFAPSSGVWRGIVAELGSSVNISGGAIRYALIGVEANPYYAESPLAPWASVVVEGADLSTNAFAIKNGPKDLIPSGRSVTATGNNLGGLPLERVSSHVHACADAEQPEIVVSRRIWDVNVGILDDVCPPGYVPVPEPGHWI
ncbi:MAG: hypothetical protein M3290_06740, partial [Actinomycetota bacterium]|nr:hypothetical protein [Actinomycetota bacterium]